MILSAQERTLHVDLKLGEICLHTTPLKLLSCKVDFTQAEAGLPVAKDHLASLPKLKTVDGVYFRSHPTLRERARISLHAGKICFIPWQYRRFIIDLNGTFADYEKHFSSKTRATIKKKVRKFAELSGGTIDWKVFRSPEEMNEFYALARQISTKTYQEKLLDSGIPNTDTFQSEMLGLANDDRVRGYVLFLNGQPVSYVYSPIHNGVVVYDYVGYDPKLREHSPGTVLQYLLLESLFNEARFRIFDFTEGEGQHKELFSTRFIRCADLFFLRMTPRNIAIVGADCILTWSTKLAVSILSKLRLDHRIKALIRYGRN